jgi:hypothetical protein
VTVQRVTKEPYPPKFRERLAKETRPDVGRIARRQTKKSPPMRPTVEWATWIARSAMTDRVRGVKARLYLVEMLRHLLAIDASPPSPPDGLCADDRAWVEKVAGELAAPALPSTGEGSDA